MSKEYSEDELFNLSDEELEAEIKALNSEESDETTQDTQSNEEEKETTNNQGETDNGLQETKEEITTTETKEDVEEKEPVVDTGSYKVKANGQEYDLTLEELKLLAPKALDYTKKTQAIAPYRRMIGALENNGISQDDINLLIDMKKGNKEAISSFIKSMNVDPLDLPEESDYNPVDYGSDNMLRNELNEVYSEINSNEELKTKFSSSLNSFDDTSKQFISSNPEAIKGLQIDIQSGMYDKIFPIASKMCALDGYKKPMLDYYIYAGQQFLKQEQEKAVREQEQKKKKEEDVKANKKLAGIPSSSSGGSSSKAINSYADIPYDDFIQWCKEVESKG